MPTYDFIYGSKVIVQCQAQINVSSCNNDDNDDCNNYLSLIGKDASFFTYLCKPKNVVTCYIRKSPNEKLDEDILEKVGTNIDDRLVERNRVLTWSKTTGKSTNVSGAGHGHGKQQIIFNAPTFCAKHMGIKFDPKTYSYSVS